MQGKILAGKYRLDKQLGQGGMGSVWQAEHLQLKSPVAVKLMDPALAQTAEGVERFQREARASAALRSTHVVQVLDFGVDSGVLFLVMEMLEGESLAHRIERLPRIDFNETVSVLSQVCRAMTRAHQAGVVHRDLKPENIFLSHEGDSTIVKVLDFGIAKAQAFSTGHQTSTGQMLGSPYYMSPEQVAGEEVDARTDLWALAVIAFECGVGRRPFDGVTLGDLFLQICTRPPPVPSAWAAVPSGFDEWFFKGVARDRLERFQSVSELIDGLVRVRDAMAAPGRAEPYLSPALNPAAHTARIPVRTQVPTHALTTHTPLSGHIDPPPESRPNLPLNRRPWLLGVGVAAGAVIVAGALWKSGSPAPHLDAEASPSAAADEKAATAATLGDAGPPATANSVDAAGPKLQPPTMASTTSEHKPGDVPNRPPPQNSPFLGIGSSRAAEPPRAPTLRCISDSFTGRLKLVPPGTPQSVECYEDAVSGRLKQR